MVAVGKVKVAVGEVRVAVGGINVAVGVAVDASCMTTFPSRFSKSTSTVPY